MDFEHFMNLCGRSLFAEEYKGDFDAAWEYLQAAQSEAFGSSADLTPRAEYLRCTAVYYILAGDFAEAYQSLDLLHALIEQLPPEWGLRYTNYKALADSMRRVPPSLRFYHEKGKPLNIPLVGDILGPNDMQPLFMENVQKYFPHGAVRDQMLCQMIPGIHGFPVTSRTLTAWFHPSSPGGTYHKPGTDPVPMITEISKSMAVFRDKAESNGANGITVYLTRLIAEFHVFSNSPKTPHVLQELYQKSEAFADHAGMANARMIEGDHNLCPPFTSPLSLNLVIVNAAAVTGHENMWDPIESDLPFDYSAEVQSCYQSALKLFQKANCKRGQAAILLRQACCFHIMALLHRQSDEKLFDKLEEVHSKLRKALALFGKDQASVQIVKTHQILLNITKGNFQGIKAYARQIGHWCASKKNEMLGHVLGLLLCRFAHQEWNKYSNMNSAVIAWECAYELLSPIKDMIPLFQSVVARASIQHEMFNQPASLVLIDEALGMVDEVRGYIDTRLDSAPQTVQGEADKTILAITKCTLLWTFGRVVGSIYLRTDNLDKFQEWQVKQADLIEHDESFIMWRNRIESDSDTHAYDTFRSVITYPAHTTKGLWRKLLADEAAKVMFGSASIPYRHYLFDDEEGDVLKAEAIFRKYVIEAEQLEKVYTRDLYRIIACERIGDVEKAREILDSISDDELFDGNLADYRNGIGLRTSFALVAQNALTFVLFGRDMDRARRTVKLITQICPEFFGAVLDNEMDYSERLGDYATIMMDLEPELCFSKLLQARHIIETRRRQTNDLDAQISSSDTGWNGEVYINLARLSLRCAGAGVPIQTISNYDHGHFDGMTWEEHALLFVEMSRARAILESLKTSTPDAFDMPNNVVYKRRLLRSLLSLDNLTDDQEQEIAELRDYLQILESDEALSSATTFIETVNSTIDPKLLYKSIDENAVVLEATFGPRGFIAFAVTRDGVQQTHESATRSVDIRRPVMQAMKIMENMSGFIGGEDETAKQQLESLSKIISEELILPFATIIKEKSHVIFSVSDPLTAFPFSILPFEDKPLIMHTAVSQTPSLTVLHYLSQRKSSSERPTVTVLAKSPKEITSGSRRGEEDDLHMAAIEAVNIARTFATWPIETSNLTRADFQQYVEGESLIMHIGTHGNLNHRNPLLSSISIGQDQEFRVVDMSAVRSNVHLLVFAACLSGLGKATIGSEVLGFSHIVLSSGCQAFIGSLWEVSDFGSMLIMTLFYRHMNREPHLAVAELMRKAQMDILHLDSEKAGALLDELMEDWDSTGAHGQKPADFVPDAEFMLLRLRMLLDQLDWTSPFYWAPFTLMGYGSFRFIHEET